MIKNTADTQQRSSRRTDPERMVIYAGVGPTLTQYDVESDGSALVKRGSVRLPANVQYAWPHASEPYLYVVSSSRPSGAADGPAGNTHHISVFRIDPASGALQGHGEPVALRHRPVHITTDVCSEHALIAYNDPSDLTVHRINDDGTVGNEVKQPPSLDVGIYAHQIRVAPSNQLAVLVTRGNDATDVKAEDPGALKVFTYENGVLTNRASIAPDAGYGFGPRHLDFHPTEPLVFVSLERQNKLHVYQVARDTLGAEPLFRKETLARVGEHRQMAGAIHVHPNGRFVYLANRAYASTNFNGKRVWSGGENSIAVYAINQITGEPTLIQSMDTHGIYPRTFALDPSGRMLIVANAIPLAVKTGITLSTVPASLSVFRIGGDGKLDYVHKTDVDVGVEFGSASMFWMGLMKLRSHAD